MTVVKSLVNKTTVAAFVVLAFVLLIPSKARAQWTTGTNGNDINSTNSGNVGVGTASPPSKLTVNVTNNADGITVDGAVNPMFSLRALGVPRGYFGVATNPNSYAAPAAPGDIVLRTQGGRLFLDTNGGVGTPALTVSGANGGVGIGTATPSNGLHVHSASGAQAIRVSGGGGGLMNFVDTSAAANQKLYQWRSEGGLFRMSLLNDSESSFAQQNILVANSSGNVGIGTAAPGARLDVAQANSTAVRALSGSASAHVNIQLGRTAAEGTLGVSAGAGHYAADSAAGDVVLRTDDPAKRLLFANGAGASALSVSGGKVGVGVTNPSSNLQLYAPPSGDPVGAMSIDVASFYTAANASNSYFFRVRDLGASWTPFYIRGDGNVGIGTTSPGAKLDVNAGSNEAAAINVTGTVSATGAITGASVNATYQDVAEWVPSTQKLAAGTVVVLDAGKTNHVLASTTPYDTKVAGVVSAEPGVILGVGGADKLKVATTGRVKVKVDATRAPIRVGDLLVTGDTEGVAMRSEPIEIGGRKMHAPGTIIGKALEPLASGTGEILVLLSLQ